MWYLLSKPDTWEVQPKDLAQGCGLNKVYKLLTELAEHGYVKKVTERSENQKFAHFSYVIYEKPFAESQQMVIAEEPEPFVSLPQMEKPFVANQQLRVIESNTESKDQEKNIQDKELAEPKKKVQRMPSDWQQIVGLCMEIWNCPSGMATKYAQMLTGKAKGNTLWAASKLNPGATLPELKGWIHWIRQSHRELPKGATFIQQSVMDFRGNQAYEDAIWDANNPPAPEPILTIVPPNPERARLYHEMISQMAEAKSLPSSGGCRVATAS